MHKDNLMEALKTAKGVKAANNFSSLREMESCHVGKMYQHANKSKEK